MLAHMGSHIFSAQIGALAFEPLCGNWDDLPEVICELERTADPLFRQAGVKL
jgi:hypothetical protein